ncbi:MAG: CopG family transcriptional regulator [Nitrospira sp. SB0677_bin_15]|nr:CopG family transcriptional regulator [Nitrospira sp. SB0667_bin_9]MYD31518.1 CopG family transcriptional regulator [Nitrospira sp. SB0661_bin_20]MYG40103.1 CopG family transcriptional regulator [Nitrospira sp. SB0677_bin_15]MYH03143.1 CopG family transcriptional regulator [Nitrospira sp. SB0675_bin_23]MYJ22273.1 CopG family transcriptional regulator [Nitrospira sp. SB0673_bin_12]
MKKKVPRFKTDQEAEQFLNRDLTDYLNLKQFTSVTFELLPKTKQVNLRFSEPLLNAVRQRAAQEGISYQKFIRRAVEGSLRN